MLSRLAVWLNPPDATDRGLRPPWRLFWVAFLVRVLYMTLAHTFRIRTLEGHFQFGWEAGRIAQALVTGHGYADPFSNAVLQHTGPTAWLPPLYPLLVAGVFKAFGVYTLVSAWVLLAINCAFSAATAMAVWEIGARCFNRRVALWSGWIWALHPAAMQYAVRWLWEMSLTTALFAWTLVLALRLREVLAAPQSGAATPRHTTRQWLLFGLFWGGIALSNPTLLLFLPVCGIWILVGMLRRQRPHAVRDAVLSGLVFVSCITPWAVRNWEVFHTLIPLRSNFGAEMYLGNGPGSTGLLMEYDHPFRSPQQLKLYAAMGEVRYVAMRGALASAYIQVHPRLFLGLTLRRIYFFWWSVPGDASHTWIVAYGRVFDFAFISLAGLMGLALALSRRVPAAGLFAWAMLLLPLPYYVVTVHARFRHPLEPLLCLFGVYLFSSVQTRRGSAG